MQITVFLNDQERVCIDARRRELRSMMVNSVSRVLHCLACAHSKPVGLDLLWLLEVDQILSLTIVSPMVYSSDCCNHPLIRTHCASGFIFVWSYF